MRIAQHSMSTMQTSDESRSSDFQASQLIRTVLRKDDVPASEHQNPMVVHGSGGDAPSLQSSSRPSSSTRSPHPQYHFHGLASTQTESQIEGQQDSQKENTPTSWERTRGTPGSPVASSPPLLVERRNARQEISGDDTSFPPMHVRAAALMQASRPVTQNATSRVPLLNPSVLGTKTVKAVSFLSPASSPHHAPHLPLDATRTKSAPARPLTRAQRHRPPSLASRDSFADSLPIKDPVGDFVARSKTFNIPLSQFDKDESSEGASSDHLSSSLLPHMWKSCSSSEHHSPPGEVLVAGTLLNSFPSQDTHTQSQLDQRAQTQGSDTSQHDLETQASDVFSHGQGQGQTVDIDYDRFRLSSPVPTQDVGEDARPSSPRDGSTEPSSSYERLLNMDPYAPNPEPDVPTQLATQIDEPTQLADPNASEADHTLNVPADSARSPLHLQSIPSTTATATTTRGVMGLINPNKRWRYMGLDFSRQDNSQDDTSPSRHGDPSSSPARYPLAEDTQPSDVAVHGSDPTGPSENGLSSPPRRRRQLPILRALTRVPQSKPEPEVIPDSEAPNGDGHRSSPSPPPTPMSITPRRAEKQAMRRVGAETRIDEEVAPGSVAADEDESDEEEDDDVPLAAVVLVPRQRQDQALAKIEPVPKGSSSRVKPTSNTNTGGRNKALALPKPLDGPDQKPSWETTIIPSSNPRQDAPGPSAAASRLRPGPTNARKKKGLSSAAGSKSRSTSRSITPVVPKRTRSVPTEEVYAGEVYDDDRDVVIPDSEGERATELADNDEMDIEAQSTTPSVSEPTRKRKRSVKSTNTKPSKAPKTKPTAAVATPTTRSNKKAKTTSALKSGTSATRVFALWKQDGHYYSGTVYSMVSPSPPRYKINFDDETTDTVDLSKMRLCQLRPGDHVLAIDDSEKGKVVLCGDCSPHDMVKIEVDDGDELDEIDIEVQRIRIASRTLQSEWNNRMLTTDTIWPIVRPKSLNSPFSSKSTVMSGGSVRGSRKFLAKTGFVVTLSPGNKNWEKEKDQLMLTIKSSGGIVLDDWTHLFTMDGQYNDSSKRWIGRQDDINWIGRSDIERVYLLSDACNQKPKFLMALAFGIPCVSVDWLQQIAAEGCEKDWQPFLLPAGFCNHLDARVSQIVDLDWGNSLQHLTDIRSNKVAPKLFAGQTILCVAPEFVPLQPKTGKRNADVEKANEASRMVPRIILAMGAACVEAVPDVKFASQSDLSHFDFIVVKEESDMTRLAPHNDVNCVPLTWVKQCLIASRLLPRAYH